MEESGGQEDESFSDEEKECPMSEYDRMLSQSRHLDAKVFGGTLLDTLLEEIALEGLDGLTVQALKVRLSQRPNFDLKGFEEIGNSIWNQLKYSKAIRFYELPEDRPDLLDYQWNKYKDDRGNAYEPLHAPDEIYPYFPVEDKQLGVRGSSQFYKTRKDITAMVRRLKYTNSVRLFGNRLVIVANQLIREKELFGMNYKKQRRLSIVQYCMMERIGRARHAGEITRGKISLTCMKIPPKTLFYNRKGLLAGGLVKRQSTSVKYISSRCPAGITVFHLPRFYKRIESLASRNIRTVFAYMNQSNSNSIPTEVITSKYGKHTLRQLQHQFSELLEAGWEEFTPKEHFESTDKKGRKLKRKVCRVLKLKVTDWTQQQAIIRRVLDGPTNEDAETQDAGEQEDTDEGQKINCRSSSSYNGVKILQPCHIYSNKSESHSLYELLLRAGFRGVTLKDMSLLRITPLEGRAAARYLSRVKICQDGVLKKRKQKAFTYTFTSFARRLKLYDIEVETSTEKAVLDLGILRRELRAAISTVGSDEGSESSDSDSDASNSSFYSVLDTPEKKKSKNRKPAAVKSKLKAIHGKLNISSSAQSRITFSRVKGKVGPPPRTSSAKSRSKKPKSHAARKSPPPVEASSAQPAHQNMIENVPQPPSAGVIQDLGANDELSMRLEEVTSEKIILPSQPRLVAVISTRELQTVGKDIPSSEPSTNLDSDTSFSQESESTQSDTEESQGSPNTFDVDSDNEENQRNLHSDKKGVLRVPKISSLLDTSSESQDSSTVSESSDTEASERDTSVDYDDETEMREKDTSLDSDDDTEEDDSQDSSFTLDKDEDEYLLNSSQEELERQELEVEAMNILERRQKADKIDEELRSKMTRQRVDWNQHDDRFILYAFIGSALFVHKYNFAKIFIYNATQIRDLLLIKTEGRSTKTSLAIRRRLHFLMNQKSFYDCYIRLMSAAVMDDVLYETIIRDHIPAPQLKIYYNPPDSALESATQYLYKKFDETEYEAGDLRTSFSGVDALLFLRQLKRMEPFWGAAMFVIFCPLDDPSKRRRFRAFWQRVLEGDYIEPDEPCIDLECDSDSDNDDETDGGGGNDSKETKPQPSEVRTKISPIPTKSSENLPNTISVADKMYYHDLSGNKVEIVSSEGQAQLFHLEMEYCFKLLKFLAKQFSTMLGSMSMLEAADKDSFSLVSLDMEASTSNLSYCTIECSSEFEIRLWTARTLVLNVLFAGDVTKSIETLMTDNFLDVPIDRATTLLRRARVIVCNKRTRKMCLSRVMLRQFLVGLTSTSYDDALDFLKYIDEIPNVDLAACLNAGILLGLVDLTDYFQPSIKITESIFTLNDEWVPVYDDIMEERDIATKNSKRKRKRQGSPGGNADKSPYKRCRLTAEEEEEIEGLIECFEDIEKDIQLPKRQAQKSDVDDGNYKMCSSTNALRLLRIRLNEAGVQMPRKHFTGFVERDFFAINLPALEFNMPKKTGLNHRLVGSSHPYSDDFMREFREKLVEIAYHEPIPDEHTLTLNPNDLSEYLGKYAVLFNMIHCSGSLGVSGEYLLAKFERKSLTRGLRYLVDARLVFSVGITQRRFVAFDNAKNWLIPIRSHSGYRIIGHVVMRPWITVHGGLNWITINQILIGLLGHLQRPSIPFDELCQCLKPTLSPVEIMILLEALQRMKYLTVYKFSDPEVRLFSAHPRDRGWLEYKVDTLIDNEDVYVAVAPYASFLYAQLQEALLESRRYGPPLATSTPTKKC